MISAGHRIILALALASALSGTAFADWLKFGDSSVGTAYVDPATIRKANGKATMWELTDYNIAPDPANPYQSVKRHFEFNCDEMVLRTLSISAYSAKMASGNVMLTVDEPAKWTPLLAGSTGETMWWIACGRAGNTL